MEFRLRSVPWLRFKFKLPGLQAFWGALAFKTSGFRACILPWAILVLGLCSWPWKFMCLLVGQGQKGLSVLSPRTNSQRDSRNDKMPLQRVYPPHSTLGL